MQKGPISTDNLCPKSGEEGGAARHTELDLKVLAAEVVNEIRRNLDGIRREPDATGRPKAVNFWDAISAAAKPILERVYGGPIWVRYAGCSVSCSREDGWNERGKDRGYLWDFLLSRHSIPAVTGTTVRNRITGQTRPAIGAGKFRSLLAAESELGDADAVCRDFLKLLESNAPLRLMIYRVKGGSVAQQNLHARLLQVMTNHELLDTTMTEWLFIAVKYGPGLISFEYFIRDRTSHAIVPVWPTNTACGQSGRG